MKPLSKKERKILGMIFFRKMTIKAIAAEIGMKQWSLYMLLVRVRKRYKINTVWELLPVFILAEQIREAVRAKTKQEFPSFLT